MKWARPTGSSRSSRKLKPHRSTRSFVGTATLEEGRVCQEHEDWRGGGGQLGRTPQTLSPTLSSLGCVHGPVGVIICDPGVAGQAPRHDGVMRAMMTAELQEPGGGDGARGQCREGLWAKGTTGRIWILGLGSPAPPHPTHASRQAEDFNRILPRAFVQHSIYGTEAVSGARQAAASPRPCSGPRTYLLLVEIHVLGLEGPEEATVKRQAPGDRHPTRAPAPVSPSSDGRV